MGLLFVGGLMNLAWAAGVAVLVLLEKTIPWEGEMRVLTGLLFFYWGIISFMSAGFDR